MSDVSFSILNPNEELIELLEKIRFDAYNFKNFTNFSSFYEQNLRIGNYLPFGVFYKKKLIGACYISKAYNSLYVEQLFIMKKFQNTELHFESSLLKFVLSQKNHIENYFNSHFKYSYLENSKYNSSIYQSLGYKKNKVTIIKKSFSLKNTFMVFFYYYLNFKLKHLS